MNRYIDAACEYYQINPANIFKRTRIREVVFSRQIFHYLIRKFEGTTLSEIGRKTGYGHDTVINSIRAVKNTRDTNKGFALWLSQTELRLRGDDEKELSRKVNLIINQIKMKSISDDEAETEITNLVNNYWLNKIEK